MSEPKGFEIDFSEVQSISTHSSQFDLKTVDPSRLDYVRGFFSRGHSGSMSGPCVIGTLLHYHGIGWNHIPKDRHGRPLNDPFIQKIVLWSATPNLPGGTMGTSPPALLAALRKAGLHADWYAGNSVVDTLEIIRLELLEGRPVAVLVNHDPAGHPLLQEWQLVCKMDENSIHTKQSRCGDSNQVWSLFQFRGLLAMGDTRLSCSIVTAAQD